MKSLVNIKIARIILALSIVTVFSMETKAQYWINNPISNNLFSSFCTKISERIVGGENQQTDEDTNQGFLNQGILIFEENLKVCKDIIAGEEKNIKQIDDSIKLQTEIEKSTVDTLKTQPKIAPVKKKKKKFKSFRNYPGNTKTRV